MSERHGKKSLKHEKPGFVSRMRSYWDAAGVQMAEFKENSAAGFAKWILVYALTALFSLLVLNTGNPSGWKTVREILTLLPFRMFTLLLFTSYVFTLKRPKSYFIFMSSLWFFWLCVAADKIALGGVMLLLFLILFVFVLLSEKPASNIKHISLFRQLTAMLLFTSVAVMVLQMVQMRSFIKPFSSFLLSPDIFACNMVCFSAVGFFIFCVRRPKFAISFYSLLWAVLAVISYFKSRNTFEPVLFLDIFSLKEGTKAFFVYYSWYFLAGLGVLIAAAIAGIVVIALKEKKREFSLIRLISSIAFVLVSVCMIYLMGHLSIMSTESRTAKDEYDRKGFVYSLLFYSFDSFVVQPEGYDPTVIDSINKNIEQNYVPYGEASDVQNIIVIQLESFSDPYMFPGIVLERDPMPFIRSLMNDYSSGYIQVPVFGGLTVKSEFEFLTGLSINNLPLGYNPYVQYVCDYPMDSIVRYFKDEGYLTTAIHDYQGEFFERNYVYENLGFDKFIPYECMPDIEKIPSRIWGNDYVFINHIEQALDANGDGKNFVFGVTVQMHGDYEPIPASEYPMVIQGIENINTLGAMEYYIQQLKYVDDMIRDLIAMLSERNEPTYVLFYSDHLPSLFTESNNELTNEQKYATPFFSWNNMGIEKVERPEREEGTPEYIADLPLYKLSTFLCGQVKIDGSFMNRFHSVYADTEQYAQEFSSIQYYKMYDELKYVKFENEEYEIGLYPLAITGIEPFDNGEYENEDGESYIITGTGFSKDTYFCINGKLVYPTEIYDDNSIIVKIDGLDELDDEDTFTLRIIGEKLGGVLKESEAYKWSDFFE